MSLDSNERSSIITAAMKKKFGSLMEWERPVLLHEFGQNDLKTVDEFEASLEETRAEVLAAIAAMTDEAIQVIGIHLADPYRISETEWGTLSANLIDQLGRFLPMNILYGFGHPDFAVDFDYWGRMPTLSLHEVTVVSVGADPDVVTEGYISEQSKLQDSGEKLWSASAFLLRQRETFNRYFHHTDWGYVDEPVSRIKMWIDQMELPVHPEFYAALEKRTAPRPTPTPIIEAKPMTSQERETLLKLIAAMACEQYGYDPRADRSTVPSSLRDDLERVGIAMDDKTIRKWLKEASQLVAAEYWQDNK